MPIYYSLTKNMLTNGANNYRAVIQSMDTVTLDQVIERMIAHGCILSRADTESTINHFFDSVESYLLDGFRVNTRGINFAVSIKGNFNGKTDSFDPARHTIEAVTSPGAQLRRVIRTRAHAQKELAGQVRPELLEYTDWNSGERDSMLTPGGLGQIIGQNLKFDPSQPDQGIFFMTPEGNSHQVGIISHNTAGQLTFLVPISLTPGDYTLEVHTSLSQGALRKGSLDATLTVS